MKILSKTEFAGKTNSEGGGSISRDNLSLGTIIVRKRSHYALTGFHSCYTRATLEVAQDVQVAWWLYICSTALVVVVVV